ncbi:hypothetical protein CYY_006141 [Polysphondylium violaceum]|uniref:Uncharacterized protein n=1 Tax=Polysphondylium violaceum TaxID=133409 RepID=A0A8J4PU05_9MYCE|nr:hypothetical protein CYY_006141 [Polysphondylium violaceum]
MSDGTISFNYEMGDDLKFPNNITALPFMDYQMFIQEWKLNKLDHNLRNEIMEEMRKHELFGEMPNEYDLESLVSEWGSYPLSNKDKIILFWEIINHFRVIYKLQGVLKGNVLIKKKISKGNKHQHLGNFGNNSIRATKNYRKKAKHSFSQDVYQDTVPKVYSCETTPLNSPTRIKPLNQNNHNTNLENKTSSSSPSLTPHNQVHLALSQQHIPVNIMPIPPPSLFRTTNNNIPIQTSPPQFLPPQNTVCYFISDNGTPLYYIPTTAIPPTHFPSTFNSPKKVNIVESIIKKEKDQD